MVKVVLNKKDGCKICKGRSGARPVVLAVVLLFFSTGSIALWFINTEGTFVLKNDSVLLLPFRTEEPPAVPPPPNCGPADHASSLLGECFCHVGWKGENCSTSFPVPNCGPYDDRCFFHPDYGVAQVSEERWKGAQAHENKTWAEQRTADRNDEHAVNFENYASLVLENWWKEVVSDEGFGHMIEFGAGPFTQSLTIFETTKILPKSITLLEPMAKNYMSTVDACRYKDGKLHGLDTTILSHAAEELLPQQQFDTVLLLNFVEHVKDAFLVYNIAFEALRPGGLLIFHERFWPGYNGMESKNRREFDLHPIRLNERFAHWMATEFDLLYEKEQPVSSFLRSDGSTVLGPSLYSCLPFFL